MKAILSAIVILTALPSLAAAGDVEVGQKAPDFATPDQNGKIHRLGDYKGRTVILAFYPKDFTGG